MEIDKCKVDLSFLKNPDGTVTVSPDGICEQLDSHFSQWFHERIPNYNLLEQRNTLMQNLQPLPRFAPVTMATILDRITCVELQNAIRSLGRKKASGPSTIVAEYPSRLPRNYLDYLLFLLNECLRLSRIPSQWKIAHLYLISKDATYSGNLSRTRPIALLEVTKKLFSKILHNRLAKLIAICGGLSGNNNGFTDGISTTDAAIALKSIIDVAHISKKDLFFVTTDISKAYDSISWHALKKSLLRLNLPAGFIELLKNTICDRSTKILTPFGPSPGFKPLSGIDQGDSLAPMLWNIFFDPILTTLQRFSNGPTVIDFNAPYFAFADDVVLLADNIVSLQESLQIFANCLEAVDIDLNTDKCSLYAVDHSRNSQNDIGHPTSSFVYNQRWITVTAHQNNPSVLRYLGCLIPMDNNYTRIIDSVREEAFACCNLLKSKSITGKMLAYIITCVLQPQILHKLMVSPVLASELNSIEAKWMSIVKERHLMYRSIPNIALWDLYNLTTLKDQLHMRQMTQFFRLLQKNTHNSSVALSSSQKLKAIRPSLFSESASQSRGRYWLPYVSRLFSLYQIELVNTTTQFLSQRNADLEAPPVATLSNVADPTDHIFHLWTDGSLRLAFENSQMTAAFLLVQNDNVADEYACQVFGRPSSKTAEFMAVIMGLRATPSSAAHIHVHTDSMAVFNFIERYLSRSRLMDDIFFAYQEDESIARTLHWECTKRGMNLSVHKEKAHSGILLNERVDRLAAAAYGTIDSRNITTLRFTRFKTIYNGTVDCSLKPTIKACQNLSKERLTDLYLDPSLQLLSPMWKNFIRVTFKRLIRGAYFSTSFA